MLRLNARKGELPPHFTLLHEGRPGSQCYFSVCRIMSLFRVATCSLRFGAARICIPTQRVYARPIRYASGLVRGTCALADALGYATEKDAKVSLNDPTENEAQKLLESGTQKLEIGDVQGAMVCIEKLTLGRLSPEHPGAQECLGLLQPRYLSIPRAYVHSLMYRRLGECDSILERGP